MKKGIVLVLIFAIAFTACKDEKKADNPDPEIVVVDENVSEKKYEVVESSFDKMQIIFDDGFTLLEGVTIDEIGVLKTGENSYKVAYFLDDNSDFEKIEELNIALRIYPKNPELFKNKADQDAKARTIASASDIKIMDKIKTIMSEEFSVLPKEFQQVKVYFYTPKDGVVGQMMTILNVQFP